MRTLILALLIASELWAVVTFGTPPIREAPRPALPVAGSSSWGDPARVPRDVSVPGARTPTPRVVAGAAAGSVRGLGTGFATAAPTALTGLATWYRTPGLVAAAGPVLRRALGRDWRGTWVRVQSGRRSVVVKLSDWCACRARHGVPTLLDLSDGAFGELGPLGVGVLRVKVSAVLPPQTDAP